jgi:hypothetical protein
MANTRGQPKRRTVISVVENPVLKPMRIVLVAVQQEI